MQTLKTSMRSCHADLAEVCPAVGNELASTTEGNRD
jgi:hypothetical protein